ncbi:hypothetical protein RYD26_01670 [Pasteurellaceae bacterium LIM206]|nr:hypothetical protein [Pasteurellaceae bacterium LIM206]
MTNPKQSSSKMASVAAKTLADPHSSKIQKSLSASVIAQSHTKKVTSDRMETMASKALSRESSSDLTKSLAASVLAQAEK